MLTIALRLAKLHGQAPQKTPRAGRLHPCVAQPATALYEPVATILHGTLKR